MGVVSKIPLMADSLECYEELGGVHGQPRGQMHFLDCSINLSDILRVRIAQVEVPHGRGRSVLGSGTVTS